MRKRLLSLLLVACMVLPLIPVAVLPALAAEGTGTYTTTFAPTSDNYPTFEGVTKNPNGTYTLPSGWATGSKAAATYHGNWEVGQKPVTVTAEDAYGPTAYEIGEGFTPYAYGIGGSATEMILSNSTAYWDKDGGLYITGSAGLWLNGMPYSTKVSGANTSDSNTRSCTDAKNVSAARYTAEYTGTVTIDIDSISFFTKYVSLIIMHNGEIVYSYTPTAEDTCVRWVEGGTASHGMMDTNGNGFATKTIDNAVTLDVKTGDKIEFISACDPKNDYDDDSTEANTNSQPFYYQTSKRGLRDASYTITYAEGYYYEEFPADYVWTGADTYTYPSTTSDSLRFMTWYKADNTPLSYGATLEEGCYAMINPLLKTETTAGILDTDSYEVAYEKFCAYLKKAASIKYTGAWSMGAMTDSGIYEPIVAMGYVSTHNLYNVTSSGKVGGWDGQYWVTSSMFDAMMAEMWNEAIYQPTGSTVADIKVAYNAEMKKITGNPGGALASSDNKSVAHANINANGFFTRPSNIGAGAYTFTAPKAGAVTLDISNMQFIHDHGVTVFDWGVAVNGEFIIPRESVDASDAGALAAMQAKIAALEIGVSAGDQISICTWRNNGKCTRLNAQITATLDPNRFEVAYVSGDDVLLSKLVNRGDALPTLVGYPNFGATGYIVNGEYAAELPATVEGNMTIADYYITSTASISITSKYAINVYVQADDDAIEAGVMVGGRKMAGKKQADGSWKVPVMDVIARDLLTAEVSYAAYQLYADGYRISAAETTVNAKNLLNAYVNGDYNDSVKALAQSVLDYAEISDNWFNNTTVSNTSGVKERLKGNPYTISGNHMSGPNDVYLATIQYVSTGVLPTYKGAFAGTEFTPDPRVTEANKVTYGYAEGVDPTDADQYKYYFSAVTLNLEEQIGFALRIKSNPGATVNDLRAGGKYAVMVESTGNTVYYDAFVYADASKGDMAIVVDGIPASLYDQNFKFTVVEEQEDGSYAAVSATLTYSVDAWCIGNFTFSSGDKISYLAQAIYLLRQAANNYVAG